MKMTRDKRRNGRRRKRTIERQRARLKSARSGTRTARHLTPTTRDLLPPPSTSPPSSQLSNIPASWLRRCNIPNLIPRLETQKLLTPLNYLLRPPPHKTFHSSYAYTMVVSSTSHRICLTPKKYRKIFVQKKKEIKEKEK
jgi:hypothetical protein